MTRPFWFAAGAGAGVYAMVRGRRAARSLGADGLRDRWSGLALGARLLREEVAAGSAARESELRERYGLTSPAATQLTGGRHRAVGPTTDEEGST